ncbi:type II secretion system protein N [Acinetobacter stercoris]|uniref:Putative type II secretion protein GspC n=1 Tax=Acinetobacter stercoris TaxID=2126983 RepID=A0A2U3N2P0_9GAMM|nr:MULTISPECIES: type II secretion system protein N [Acinetobacter]SPL71809.1 putative type II secretion protein GspC [Acinetobacter stercoris]
MINIKEKLSDISWQKLDRVAPIVLIILILALCWKLASMFWWIVAPPQVMKFDQVALGSQQPQVPNISSFSLFQEQAATESQDDNINFALQGVVVAYPSQNSSAVIKVNETADNYVIGQKLDSTSYQLAEVYWDKVILKNDSGATKELKFAKLETLNQNLSQPEQTNQSSPSSVPPASAPGTSSDKNALGQAIQKMQQDRDQYLKNMGVNTAGGQGYEVTDNTPAALRNKLGLRSGDRIISLNGQPVGQGQTDVQLLEQAKRDGKVKIEIKRGDQVMTIQQSL